MKKPSKLALAARAERRRYVAEKRTIRILHPVRVRCTQCGEVYEVHDVKHGPDKRRPQYSECCGAIEEDWWEVP